jgi:hypothetical protein
LVAVLIQSSLLILSLKALLMDSISSLYRFFARSLKYSFTNN